MEGIGARTQTLGPASFYAVASVTCRSSILTSVVTSALRGQAVRQVVGDLSCGSGAVCVVRALDVFVGRLGTPHGHPRGPRWHQDLSGANPVLCMKKGGKTEERHRLQDDVAGQHSEWESAVIHL